MINLIVETHQCLRSGHISTRWIDVVTMLANQSPKWAKFQAEAMVLQTTEGVHAHLMAALPDKLRRLAVKIRYRPGTVFIEFKRTLIYEISSKYKL